MKTGQIFSLHQKLVPEGWPGPTVTGDPADVLDKSADLSTPSREMARFPAILVYKTLTNMSWRCRFDGPIGMGSDNSNPSKGQRMSIPLANQHLTLFGIRPAAAADLTADQRNIFQRPITVATEGVPEIGQGQASGEMTGETSSEWLRKAESYRSGAAASQQAKDADTPTEPRPEPEAARPEMAEQPEPAPQAEPAPQPEPAARTEEPAKAADRAEPAPPRRGGLLDGLWRG
ncbi:hypothetical protein [Paracoccus sediminilitoris]|uniref:hypothetical protein n=1 Tax=Paracoccus sediminilitoris TaxID=2202419 RepID=UPI001F1EF9F1|nr:hypothetical protein [Paracoccus sediminilitoris]